MLPVDQQPYKVASVGNRLTMLEAYRKDIDFWGNGERKIYHRLTKSLADFLLNKVSMVRDNSMTFWCDIGCGPGYFLEGISATMHQQGHIIIPSGVDVSPEALIRCRKVFQNDDFIEVDLDKFKEHKAHRVLPWINASVVSFIDTLQYFKNYRQTFNEIYDGLQVGTIIVVADGMVRSNLRDYPKSIDSVALLGEWIDYTEPLATTPKKSHLKYRIYCKMS